MWGLRSVGCFGRGLLGSRSGPSLLLTRSGGLGRFSSSSVVHHDQRKKKKPQNKLFEEKQISRQRCFGYRTAEEYNLSTVQGILSNHQMSPTILEADEVIHARIAVEAYGDYPSFGKNVFFFKEHGSVVCWGTTPEEELGITRLLRQCEKQPLLHNITEQMDCFLHDRTTRVDVNSGGIYLEGTQLESEMVQQQLAFSYAIVASLELEQRELDLEELLDKIEPFFQDIVRKPPSGRQIQDIMAQEILLRGKINLHTSILDTPETYWDRHDLEALFEKTRDSLDITRRVSKLNATLQHLHQMVEVLKHDRQESVSNKLELWIIALICIEIFCALLEKSENWRHFRWEHLFSDEEPTYPNERRSKMGEKWEEPYRVVGFDEKKGFFLQKEDGPVLKGVFPIEQLKVVPEVFDEEERVYEVEKVLNHRGKKGKRVYEVKWKGHEQTTWELEEHFDSFSYITNYWKGLLVKKGTWDTKKKRVEEEKKHWEKKKGEQGRVSWAQ